MAGAAYSAAKVADFFGDRRAWIIALCCQLVPCGAILVISPSQVQAWLVFFSTSVMLVSNIIISCLSASSVSIAVDYDHWKYGENRSATVFAVYSLVLKISGSCGGALGFFIVGLYAFDATALSHSAQSAIGLNAAMSWVPALFIVLSILCVSIYPLKAHHHGVIRRCIERMSRSQQMREQLAVKG